MKKKGISLKTLVILMDIALILMLLLSGIYYFYTIRTAQRDLEKRISESINDRFIEADAALLDMNGYLVNTLHNAVSIDNLLAAQDVHTQNVAARKLIDDFQNRAARCGFPVNFYFLCDKNNCEFHVFSSPDYSYSVGMEVIRTVQNQNTEYNASNQWHYLSCRGTDLIIKTYRYRDCMICCWIPLDGLLFSVREDVLSDKGTIRYLPEDSGETNSLVSSSDDSSGHYTHLQKLKHTDLWVQINDTLPLNMNGLFVPLVIVMLITAPVFALSCYTIFYFRRHIQRPIRNMSNLIADYSSQQALSRKSGIREINETLDAMSEMRKKLEELRIDIYEERLRHTRTELQFYQLQIKPHFFVNCFSIIYAMAQKKNYAGIQNFCLKLSSYVRFLFLNSFDLIELRRELAHLTDYLDIQNIRHHTSSTIRKTVDEDLLDALVPPMMLITFVENSVKYARLENEDIEIELEISSAMISEQPMLYLALSDNGVGIDPSMAEKINEDEMIVDQRGEHVGISNVRHRLSLLFGTAYMLKVIPCQSHPGTTVEIMIPLRKEQDVEYSSDR